MAPLELGGKSHMAPLELGLELLHLLERNPGLLAVELNLGAIEPSLLLVELSLLAV